MTTHDLIEGSASLESEVLDHSRDFVDCVQRLAPAEYHRLVGSGLFEQLVRQGGFNHGKLFCYAEFTVFRREFLDRFPGASKAACINAFSALFLKNDISISNLLTLMEGSGELAQLKLGPGKGPDRG
jgi:hypothetical protein